MNAIPTRTSTSQPPARLAALLLTAVVLGLLLHPNPADAQGFDVGSLGTLGDVVVKGVIDVNGSGPTANTGGSGGPGGFDGGKPGFGAETPPGAGYGPGGGQPGGNFCSNPTAGAHGGSFGGAGPTRGSASPSGTAGRDWKRAGGGDSAVH